MRRRAFTLIELLIVVAIIAILAAIAVPNFLHAQIRAKVGRSLADMKTIGTAVECFRAEHGLDLRDHWDAADAFRYDDIGYGHTNLHDESTPASNRSMNIVYNVLTTPIAYIKALPRDPFLKIKNYQQCIAMGVNTDACRVLSLLRGTYWYADQDGHNGLSVPDHNIGALREGTAALYGVRFMHAGEWVVLGVGPDDKPESINEYVIRGVPYEPSNGLISKGDLWCRSSGEATLGGGR